MTFPFTEAPPIQFHGPLPEASDVVIIGGGIIGVTAALFLARRSVSVTLLEKGRVAAEQSSRNWGWIRQQGRDPDELPIVIEARRLWRELAEQCGEDIGLRQTGVTYLARTDKEMDDFAAFLRIAKVHGVDTRLLDSDGAAALIPAMSRRFRGAMTTPSDMRAEPWVAVPAIARLAAREGVTIVENCAARLLDIAAGKVKGLWTEKGRIATSTVLVAGGAWSSLFLRAHGVSIPQLSVRATVAATEPMPEVHAGAATDEHIAFRRRQDGGYTLAAGGGSSSISGRTRFATQRNICPASGPIRSASVICRPRRADIPMPGRRRAGGTRIAKVRSSGCVSSIRRLRRPRCAPSVAASGRCSHSSRRCGSRRAGPA